MRQLAVTGLHKAFGSHPVLTGVDLNVPAGSFTAILGPSGSGKTTMLRLLAGFERADAGSIAIGDRVVDGPGAAYVPPERRKIGYVPQEGALFPHLTVAGNVGFGLPARDRRGPRTAELLDAVGLAGLGDRYPHQLSGGQQQRVALARALAIRPEVVLLDEPFASLDAHLRASVRADVQQICHAAGTTAILVTHDQDEALSMADRVAVLRDGRIVQYAAPQDLYMRPADAALARFIGEANLLEGQLTVGPAAWAGAGRDLAGADPDRAGAGPDRAGANPDRAVDTILGRLPLEPASQVGVGPGLVTVLIRPEQLEVAAASFADSTEACLHGQVVACEYYGHDAVVRVQPDAEPGSHQVIVRTSGGPQLPAGARVVVRARGPVIAWAR
jgi:iron(III) transport system ATP-binding protein